MTTFLASSVHEKAHKKIEAGLGKLLKKYPHVSPKTLAAYAESASWILSAEASFRYRGGNITAMYGDIKAANLKCFLQDVEYQITRNDA